MYLLSGYSYRSPQGPCLQLDDMSSQAVVRHRMPIWGQYISISPLQVRYCIGGYDLLTGRPTFCLNKNQVIGEYPYCPDCSQTVQFNPAFYRFAPSQLSIQQQSYNLQPHSVYLAYFGKNMLKVGIAYTKRLYTRWLEQGARAALVLQHMPDAYAARALEERISTTYRIPERITNTRKQQYLHVLYDFEEASRVLSTYRNLIAKNIDVTLSHPIEDLQGYYFNKKQPLTLYETNKERQGIVGGYVLGMVGEILIYKQQSYSFIQPIKELLGRAEVKLGEYSQPIGLNIQTKLDLFG